MLAPLLLVALPAIVVLPLAGVEPGCQVALKLVVLAVAGTVLARRRLHEPTTVAQRWLLAFAAAAIVSTLAAGSGLAAGAPSLLAAVCLLITARAASGIAWRDLETAVAAGALAVALVALLELLGVRWAWTFVRRPESTLGNRNEVAMYLAIALPIVVGAALRGRAFAAPLAALLVAVVVATRCRGAYLGGTAGLVCAVACCERSRIRRVALALVLGVACGALPWPGVRFQPSVADATSRVFELDGSGLVRVRQHELAWAAVADEPRAWLIGLGAGSWERTASRWAHAGGGHAPRFTGATVPNSELLRIGAEQGVLGLALLAGASLAIARSLARATDRRVRAGIAALVAAAVCGLFDPVLVRPENVAVLGAIAGCGALRGAPGLRWRWALAPVCAIACCVALLRAASFAAVLAGHPELATALLARPAIDEQLAVQTAIRGDCDAAARALTRFVAARPYHWGARVAVARCLERSGRGDDAVRMWRSAFVMEPHLRELLTDPKQEKS